ncbi:MAG: hypothetical protein Q7S39_08065 [Ignavibacteria bacterium]|nr:hypothetical protein [Ignavibacteria bacterium]
MLKLKIIFTVLLSLFLFQTSKADDLKKELQKYMNEIITEVREAETPEEKREILNDLFENLQGSFEVAKNSPLVPEEDHKGIEILYCKINERQNELNGLNGFERVPDIKLNEFAYFSLQDIEQADTLLTISLTTLLLIIILAILIF